MRSRGGLTDTAWYWSRRDPCRTGGRVDSALSSHLCADHGKRIEKLAKRTGRSKTFYGTQAIEEHLQEPEDIYIAEQRLIELCAGRRRTSTSKKGSASLGWQIKFEARIP